MGTHQPETLWSLWRREQLEVEMAVGHILQNLIKQQNAQAATNVTVIQFKDKVRAQQTELSQLRRDVEHLQATVGRLTAQIERGPPQKRARQSGAKSQDS